MIASFRMRSLWTLLGLAFLSTSDAFAALSEDAPIVIRDQTATATTDVAMRTDGGFIAVWDREAANHFVRIEGRCFAADGSPVGGVFRISKLRGGNQHSPSVAVSGNGRFLVAWYGQDEDDPAAIQARVIDQNCYVAGPSFVLHNPTPQKNEFAPSVARDRDGFAVAWASDDGVHV